MNFLSPYSTPPFVDRTTSALSMYPGGIGYANRLVSPGVNGVGGFYSDYIAPIFGGVVERAGEIGKSLLDQLLDTAAIKGKQAAGYQTTGQIVRQNNRDYVVMRKPNGILVAVDSGGNEVEYASISQTAQTVDPRTGRISPTTVGIGIAAVAAIAIAYLLTRKR